MSRPLELEVAQTRRYAVDLERIERDFAVELAEDIAGGRTKAQSLRETFFELCGLDRDCDHIDGKYIWLIDDDAYIDWTGSFVEARR